MNNMLKNRLIKRIIIVFVSVFLIEMNKDICAQANNKVEIDTVFTTMFQRDCCGLTGADGIYSVLLPNGKTFWIFGDTFLGTVSTDGSREKIDPVFIRNSVALQSGFDLKTYYGKTGNRDASFFIPPGAPVGKVYSEDSLWFWPGDAFVVGDEIKVFLSSFYQKGEGGWGFQWVGTWLASIDVNTMKIKSMSKIDIQSDKEIHWGHAICDEADDYIYIYGLGNGKPYVARVAKTENNDSDIKNASSWFFYNGKDWSQNINEVKPMIDFEGGEQFSVFKLNDKFVYLSQGGGFSHNIYAYNSSNPYSNWSKGKIIYEVPASENENIFPYNALAHPQFTKDGKLLISYCVNSFRMEDVFENADNYRPRFIRIPINTILNSQQ